MTAELFIHSYTGNKHFDYIYLLLLMESLKWQGVFFFNYERVIATLGIKNYQNLLCTVHLVFYLCMLKNYMYGYIALHNQAFH